MDADQPLHSGRKIKKKISRMNSLLNIRQDPTKEESAG